LQQLALHNYALIVVTNQAGIAKGFYTETDYQNLTHYMINLLQSYNIHLDAVYHCPHHPNGVIPYYTTVCNCRKPAAGMLLQAAADHKLHLASSVLIGDKSSDIAAGQAAGVRYTVIVESGHALQDHDIIATHRCSDLAAAANWICNQ
jgi:D-glycero-D-manno-heptose 1,7-bisphosphate phosphatase